VTRYVVVGAGAVGGTIGGLLADAGREVLLVARGAHLLALQQGTLLLARPDRLLSVDVPACSTEDLVLREDDVLVLAAKTQSAAGLLNQLAALPGASELPVLCASNGLDSERQALRRFPRVHGVCVMLPATHLEPGRVINNGAPLPGLLEVGSYPGGIDDVDREVAADLSAAGFEATPREDVMAWKRAKLLRNVGNAVEALGGHDAPAAELRRLARSEAEAALAAAGLAWVDDATWDAHRASKCEVVPVEGAPRSGGSTWQSVTRGAGEVEVDFLNGEVALLGRLHGVPTPVNALLQREVNALARRGGPAGSVSLPGLLEQLRG
jgi:2-dehydropantoate 2-reductase